MADKVTAAAITVIVAGTVSVGAVRSSTLRSRRSPRPVTASPAPVPVAPAIVTAVPPVRSKPVVKPHHKPHHKPADQTQGPGPDRNRRSRRDTDRLTVPDRPEPHPRARDASAASASGTRVVRGVHDVGGPRGGEPPARLAARDRSTQRSAALRRGRAGRSGGQARRYRRHGLPRLRRLDRWRQRLDVQPLAVDRHPRGAVYSTRRGATSRRRPRRTTARPRTSSRADSALSSVPAHARLAGPARRDHLDLAGVLGRWVALRDQRLHGRILSQNTPAHEQP